MAHNYNSGYAVVDTDPNGISTLQSGHKIRLASFEDGSKVWRFVEANSAGSKWVELPLSNLGSSQTLQETLNNGNNFDSEITGGESSTIKQSKTNIFNNTINSELTGENLKITGLDLFNKTQTSLYKNDGISVIGENITGNSVSASLNSSTFGMNETIGVDTKGSVITSNGIVNNSTESGKITSSTFFVDGIKLNEPSTNLLNRTTDFTNGKLSTNSNGNEFEVTFPYDILNTSSFNTIDESIAFPLKSGTVALTSDIPQIQGGTNITIDNTNPLQPIINSSGGGSETLTTLGIESLSNTLNYQDENSNTTSVVIKPVIDVTYSQLMTLITGGNLVRGQEYRITDFVNHYIQLETGIDTTTAAAVTEGIVPPNEVLVVKARSHGDLETYARSENYPNDVLRYTTTSEVPSGGKGRITYREDTVSKLRGDFDWRNEYFRLYRADCPVFDAGTTYNRHDWVKLDTGGGNFQYYCNTTENAALFGNVAVDEGANALNNRKRWARWDNANGLYFNLTGTSGYNGGYVLGETTTISNIIKKTAEYDNFKAFSRTSSTNVYVSRGIVTHSNIINATIIGEVTGKVVFVSGIRNSNLRVDDKSFVSNVTNLNQRIRDSFVLSLRSTDKAVGLMTSPHALNTSGIQNSVISELSVNRAIRATDISITQGVDIFFENNGGTLRNVTFTEGTFKGGPYSVRISQGMVAFKAVNIRMSDCSFGSLCSRVYMQTSDTPEITAARYVNMNRLHVNSPMSEVQFKVNQTTELSFNLKARDIVITVPKIDDSIILWKSKTSFNAIASYRNPTTKILNMHQANADIVGNITYSFY